MVGENILDVRILEKNDQPLFDESLQTSRDSFGWGYESNTSWDVRLDSPKSGVSFFRCPRGGRGKYFGRPYPQKNDQPLFEESLQRSRYSFGWGYNVNKSWDVRLDSPKKVFHFLAVRTVVGENIVEAF